MLRSKYKAEDYLTSEKNAEKKKVSQVSSDSLCQLCVIYSQKLSF